MDYKIPNLYPLKSPILEDKVTPTAQKSIEDIIYDLVIKLSFEELLTADGKLISDTISKRIITANRANLDGYLAAYNITKITESIYVLRSSGIEIVILLLKDDKTSEIVYEVLETNIDQILFIKCNESNIVNATYQYLKYTNNDTDKFKENTYAEYDVSIELGLSEQRDPYIFNKSLPKYYLFAG